MVQCDDVQIDLQSILLGVVQGEIAKASPTFVGSIGGRMVDKNLAHQLCGHGKEMGAILPLRKVLPDQTNICFVDQSGALQGMSGSLIAKIVLGDPPEFLIDERDQRIEGIAVSAPPTSQQLCNLTGSTLLQGPRPKATRGGCVSLEAYPFP